MKLTLPKVGQVWNWKSAKSTYEILEKPTDYMFKVTTPYYNNRSYNWDIISFFNFFMHGDKRL